MGGFGLNERKIYRIGLECDDASSGVPLDLMGRSFFCSANTKLAEEFMECIEEGRSKF